jgi:hypothetical protein
MEILLANFDTHLPPRWLFFTEIFTGILLETVKQCNDTWDFMYKTRKFEIVKSQYTDGLLNFSILALPRDLKDLPTEYRQKDSIDDRY